MRRLALLMGGILGPTLALASFELMLIPGENRVYRYDPANDVRLGSFVANDPDYVVPASNGNAFVGSATLNNVRPYSYSTGLATGPARTFGASSNVINNGTILVTPDSSQIRTYDPATGVTANFAIPAGMTSSAAITAISGGRFVVVGRDAAGNIVGSILNSAMVAAGALTTLVPAASVAASGAVIGGAITLNTNVERVWISYRTNANTHFVVSGAISPTVLTGVVTSSTSSLFFNTGATPTIVPSHDGYYLVGEATNTAQTGVVRYITSFSSASPVASTTLTDIDCPSALTVGMVVAPEPGTMAALTLGLIPILKRRNSRKSQ